MSIRENSTYDWESEHGYDIDSCYDGKSLVWTSDEEDEMTEGDEVDLFAHYDEEAAQERAYAESLVRDAEASHANDTVIADAIADVNAAFAADMDTNISVNTNAFFAAEAEDGDADSDNAEQDTPDSWDDCVE